MSNYTRKRTRAAYVAVVAGFALVLAGCGGSGEAEGEPEGGPEDSGEVVELTFLTGTVETNVQAAEALAEAFNAENPDIQVSVDASMPSGSEGDNLLKTMLATGEAPDMFWYNSGSLFQALNPDQNLLNVADEPWVESLNDAFVTTVSTDNGVYGPPLGTATGGGVFYWVPTYEALGLEVPTTWDDFMANNEAIKASGQYGAPVIQSYADTWTAQMFVLADFFNVYASDPDWAEKYTSNEAKFATDAVARRGFEKIQEVAEAGYLNPDFASTTYDDALARMGQGADAHYPMLTFAIDAMMDLYPEAGENVGFFAMPGEGDNGLSVWMPPGLYAPKGTEHPDAVKKFMAFVASPTGCDAMTAAIGVSGPYLVEGCTIPDDVPRAVSDMLPYFEQEGATSPALEFLSPIKGPALEQICVEVGSGIRSAEDGAALYDDDVKKQAQQLGLEGW